MNDQQTKPDPITKPAFTLIELLVAVTIIVGLLSLLTPAMDRAIYTAEMAVCGTTLGGAARAGLTYAVDYQRRYPYRLHTVATRNGGSYGFVNLNNGTGPGRDDRVTFRGYLSPNNSFNCPLSAKLPYVGATPGTLCYGDPAIWMGGQYGGPQKGMFKMGDRLTWFEPRPEDPANIPTRSTNVLISSFAATTGYTAGLYANHPDSDGTWYPITIDDAPSDWNASLIITWSRYQPGAMPYRFDLNFALDDASVVRIDRINPNESDDVQWGYAWTDPVKAPTLLHPFPR